LKINRFSICQTAELFAQFNEEKTLLFRRRRFREADLDAEGI
jgi:hypothetical protein